MIKSFCLIIFLSIVLTSCGSALYEKNKDVNELGWHKDSTYVFETGQLTDLPDAIVFGVNIRNTIDYKYRNFWCYMSIKLPNGKVFTDTIDHMLLSPEGHWLANVEGGNSIKSSNVFFKYPINNPDSGVYTISLRHGMREESLKSIVSMSAFIKEFKK
mgnify:CR=1 FL=1|jgi:gliding motility-associated lipoprotein GldH|tara:strand:+ start:718 stop:1191 length:474 start_codon:yes stop_codon:yes gene_type:complete